MNGLLETVLDDGRVERNRAARCRGEPRQIRCRVGESEDELVAADDDAGDVLCLAVVVRLCADDVRQRGMKLVARDLRQLDGSLGGVAERLGRHFLVRGRRESKALADPEGEY